VWTMKNPVEGRGDGLTYADLSTPANADDDTEDDE